MAQEIKKVNGVYMGSQEIASTRFAGDANLVQYTKFEGNSTATTGANGTDTDITYSAANGKFGQGAGFNGTSSGIQYAAKIVSTGAKTISFWMNPTTAQDGEIIDEAARTSTNAGINITYHGITANKLTFFLFKSTGGTPNFTVAGGTALTVGNWYFVTCTWDGTTDANGAKIYLNGILDGTSTALSTSGDTGSFNTVLGRQGNGGASYFAGKLDDFTIFSRALTSDEIYSLYKTGVKKLNGVGNYEDSYTKLLLHCDGTDASTTFTDDSGTGKVTTAVANAQIDTAQSKFGGASCLLDGTGDYLSIPDNDDFCFGALDFTVDFWIRRNEDGVNRYLCGQSDAAGANRAFEMTFLSANTIICRWWAGGVNKDVSSSPNTITNDSNWHHVAVVRYGNNLVLYIDGVGGTAKDITGLTNDNSNTIFAIGAMGLYADYTNGWIDEFRISKGIARWTGNFTPPTNRHGTNIKKVNGVSNV